MVNKIKWWPHSKAT